MIHVLIFFESNRLIHLFCLFFDQSFGYPCSASEKRQPSSGADLTSLKKQCTEVPSASPCQRFNSIHQFGLNDYWSDDLFRLNYSIHLDPFWRVNKHLIQFILIQFGKICWSFNFPYLDDTIRRRFSPPLALLISLHSWGKPWQKNPGDGFLETTGLGNLFFGMFLEATNRCFFSIRFWRFLGAMKLTRAEVIRQHLRPSKEKITEVVRSSTDSFGSLLAQQKCGSFLMIEVDMFVFAFFVANIWAQIKTYRQAQNPGGQKVLCFMMVHDGSWWFMMVHDGSWWFMMVHDGSCFVWLGNLAAPNPKLAVLPVARKDPSHKNLQWHVGCDLAFVFGAKPNTKTF